MKLSSAYLADRLRERYEIVSQDHISGEDEYFRPFFLTSGAGVPRERVCVMTGAYLKQLQKNEKGMQILKELDDVLLILTEWKFEDRQIQAPKSPYIRLNETIPAIDVLNTLQRIFDRCDDWIDQLNTLVLQSGSIQRALKLSAEMLGNPLVVMGMDFTLTAEGRIGAIAKENQLFTDQIVNLEYMNAFIQDESYKKSLTAEKPMLLPAFINGCRMISMNLWTKGEVTHRVVVLESHNKLSEGDKCLLVALASYLEYILLHEPSFQEKDDLDDVCRTIVTDRTADYLTMSNRLAALGWSSRHEYFCLVLQTARGDKEHTAGTICKYIKKQFPHSTSFQVHQEIVCFFNLTRTGQTEEEVEVSLIYFIRDSYLKAGYSRTMEGHMNLRRQYLQAKIALDVGGRKKPYVWIHKFDQIVLTYIMEQTTKRLPASMLCHERLLELKKLDEIHHSEYMLTLRTYLEQNLNATQTANEMFIHRSTFLYRLEKIKAVLQSSLEDPDEIFYLNLSLRLLEQEEKEG